ncbi:hypothetical protein C8R45DRAFT_1022900 [Mycena sanguinolenta]|nr:hypothetical protein C8R45DRAFT_1022900 [Mycena sanguinolenta]
MQFDPRVPFDTAAVKCVHSCSRYLLTVPRLPPEIHEIIVDLLFDDKDALRTCSLVDKAWLNDRCESFQHLCHSPRGAIGPYIGTLSITSPNDADYINESASFFLDLVPYLPPLPALTSVEISSLSWQNASQQSLSCMAECFSNVTELCIHLQMLETLSIGATFAIEDQASSSIPPPNLLHLLLEFRVLRLRVGLHGAGAFPDIISWFIPRNGLPAIQAFSIASLDSSLLPVVGSLLRELGSTLKDLDIWFMSTVTVAEVNTHIDLTRNRGLRSVTVHNLGSTSWALLEGISIDFLSVDIFVDSMAALDHMDMGPTDLDASIPDNRGESLDVDTVQRGIRRRVPEWADQMNTEIKLELKSVLKFYDEFMKFKSPSRTSRHAYDDQRA